MCAPAPPPGGRRASSTSTPFPFGGGKNRSSAGGGGAPAPALASMADQYWRDHISGSIADYVRLVEEAKSAGVPVLLGLEMDWIHGREDELRRFLAPYDWDIVL